MTEPLRLRAGAAGHTLYQVNPDGTETLIGMVDTRDLAAQIVNAVNGVPARQDLAWLWEQLKKYSKVTAAQKERGRFGSGTGTGTGVLEVTHFVRWLEGTFHPGEGR